MWSLRVIILLLFCYTCLSSGNRNVSVRFESTNFHSTLHWDAAHPATGGPPPLYTVKYKIYKDNSQFETKADCQNILTLTCDLSNETASDYSEHYLAQVLVNDRLHGHSTRFKPTAHTHLGPPVLSTSTSTSSLHVNVTLPLGPNNISVGDIIRGSRSWHSKTDIIYTLQITKPAWAAHSHSNTIGSFAISLRKQTTEFCGFVSYRPSSEAGRRHSDRANFCVPVQHEEALTSDAQYLCVSGEETPSNPLLPTSNSPLRLLPWLLIAAVPLVVLLILAAAYTGHYVKARQEVNTPEMLKSALGVEPRVMQLPDCNLTIYNLEVNPSDEIRPYQEMEKPQYPVPSDGYSPQDIPSQQPVTWNPRSSNSSCQSSVIYSTVGGHNQEGLLRIDGNNIPLFTTVTDRQGPKPALPDTLDSSPDTDLRPLLLDTVRDADGKLRLTLQLFGSGDEARGSASQSGDERCGTWLPNSDDSGCDSSTPNTPTQPYLNSHYCPAEPQGGGDALMSGYKQNWMPENIVKPAGECGDTRMHYALTQAQRDEEGEALAEKDMCMRSEILLGSWMVQVQD